MRLVRSAAAAMNSSGLAMISKPGGMMLADPGFVIAEPVEMIDQLQIALDAQRRVLVDRMKGREEDAVLEFDGHELSPVSL